MDSQENANIDGIVAAIGGLNINTKLKQIRNQHIQKLDEFLAKEESGAKPFENRESYEEFCIANMVILSKAKHIVWSGTSEDISDPEKYKGESVPPIMSFHYTEEEKELQKTLDFHCIEVGDVVHLQVVEDDKDKIKLHILNKYGKAERIADSMLYANLIKDTIVKQIAPPLKKDDLVRAVVFGNVRLQDGVYADRLVSLNSKFVKDPQLKDLKLGRVFKKDIPYYPEDISEYKSLGEYLEKNDTFYNPKQILQQTRTLGVDPLKTGPIYDVKIKKNIQVPRDAKLPEFDYGAVLKKTYEAEIFLSEGLLKEAHDKINESLSVFSEDSRALTVKGKILLATADVVSTLKPKIAHKKKYELLKQQAYLSFVHALKINPLNSEAINFHDSILNEAMIKNPSMANETKPHVQQPNHVDPRVEEFIAKFKGKICQPVKKETAKPSDSVAVKAEPMNI